MNKRINDYLNDREVTMLKNFCNMQFNLMHELGGEDEPFISFKSEGGINIVSPFFDECGTYEVDPVECYGDDFLNSKFMDLFKEDIVKF